MLKEDDLLSLRDQRHRPRENFLIYSHLEDFYDLMPHIHSLNLIQVFGYPAQFPLSPNPLQGFLASMYGKYPTTVKDEQGLLLG